MTDERILATLSQEMSRSHSIEHACEIVAHRTPHADFYGIKSRQGARDLVHRARAHSKLTQEQALTVAQEQVRAVRRKP